MKTTTGDGPRPIPTPANPVRPRRAAAAMLMALAVLGAGCAGLPAARMALPAPLAAQPPEAIEGLGAGRSGRFTLAGAAGRFERGADRLSLFETLDFDRVGARYTLARDAGGDAVAASCRGRQTTLTVGVVTGTPRRFELRCEWSGVPATLRLEGVAAAAGTRSERTGRFDAGGTQLELQSVHRVEGSPLPLAAPIGYTITHRGTPVGAIELNGSTPRLWRPPAGDPLHEPVTLAALALALLWDPAS